MAVFVQVLLNSVLMLCVLSLATMGIVIIFKTSTTTNFAQSMMSVFGAYVTAVMTTMWGLPFFVGIIAGILSSFIIGVLIDVCILRKGRYVNPISKQMITMGLVMIFLGLIPFIFGVVPIEVPPLVQGVMTVTIAGAELSIPWHAIACFGITAVVLVAIALALKYTKWGLGVRAVAANEYVASVNGVNTRFITAFSWALAGALGSLAAIMFASNNVLSPAMMATVQVNGFLACVLGGFSTFFGPIAGAAIIVIGANLLGLQVGIWASVALYALILIVILIKPVGIFGKKFIKKV